MTVRLRTYADRARSVLDRRRFIGLAGATATYLAMRSVEEVAVRTVLDPMLEEARDPFVSTDIPLSLLDSTGHQRQRAAFARWREGMDVAGMLPEIDAEARHAVLDFSGDRARYAVVGAGLSVFARDVVGRPVAEAPDPGYGAFVYRRAAVVAGSRAPALKSCSGQIGGRTVRYLSLMLPTPCGVVSVGYPESEWPTAARPVSARPNGGRPSLGISATI